MTAAVTTIAAGGTAGTDRAQKATPALQFGETVPARAA